MVAVAAAPDGVVCPVGAHGRPRAVQWVYDRSTRSKILTTSVLALLTSPVLGVALLVAHARTVADLQQLSSELGRAGSVGDAATLDGLRAGAEAATTAAEQDWRVALVLAGVIVLLGGGFALAWALAFAKGIEGGLRGVCDVALALGDGDLTKTSSFATKCEIGDVSVALDVAVMRLRGLMQEVSSSADAVVGSSRELSAASGRISVSSEWTSARAEVVSAAAGDVSRTVGSMTSSSERIGAAIGSISRNAFQAAQVAADAVEAVAGTSATAVRLGEASQQIGDVVKVITSIAEQTNLLALNASIEAARAGHTGRGFAVVAQEVKDLARETARATDGITRRVEGIQGEVVGMFEAIGRIGSVIDDISGSQTSIASAVEEQTAMTAEMVRSVTEAATASGEIAATMEDVSAAATTTTQSIAQSQTVVDSLAGRATSLREAVGRLKL